MSKLILKVTLPAFLSVLIMVAPLVLAELLSDSGVDVFKIDTLRSSDPFFC